MKYGGFVQQTISALREALRMSTPTIEAQLAEVGKNGVTDLAVMYSAILQFARFGEVVADDPEKFMNSEFGRKLSGLSKDVMLARYTDNPVSRAGYINNIVLMLWPWIKEELDRLQQQNSQGSQSAQNSSGGQGGQGNNNGQNIQSGQNGQCNPGGQSNQGVPSSEIVQKILEQLQKGASQSGTTQAPQNVKSSKEAKKRTKEAAKNGSGTPEQTGVGVQRGSQSGNTTMSDKALDKLISEIAQDMAAKNIQSEIKNQNCVEIHAVDQNSAHKGVPINVLPQTEITEADKMKYKSVMSDLIGYSKRLQRRMAEELRNLRDGGVAHHKVVGNRFEVRSAFRKDERFFAKKTQPQDLPEMAISVLIDHSGSMSGDRIEAAMKAAMLLYDFATKLEIPVAVAGHDTDGDEVNYYTYTDFREVSSSERYRLAKMSVSGCNRDGLAIEIAGNLLSKRPEDVKLLFIISDGQPNHNGYSGDSAEEDIREIVRRYRKKGVEVIATAIGCDKERIKSIYGERFFLDIDALDRLPYTLAKMVRKRIVQGG